jgi:hypothetical protein
MLYIYIMDFYSAVEKEIMLFSEKMDWDINDHVKQNKTNSEKQVSHVFSHM